MDRIIMQLNRIELNLLKQVDRVTMKLEGKQWNEMKIWIN